jgi:Anticodon binding domain.
MDLIGIPVRIVVSAKTLEDSEVELKQRTRS